MRRGPHIADLQINLVPKGQRKAQSHDIAKRVRPRVAAIAAKYGARVAVAEVPPGTAGPANPGGGGLWSKRESRLALAHKIIDIFHTTKGVVDTDWYIEADQAKVRLVVDKEKAALNGISEESIAQTLKMAVGGARGGFAALAAREGGRADRGAPAAIPANVRRTTCWLCASAAPIPSARSCPCASWSRRSGAWWTRAFTTRT